MNSENKFMWCVGIEDTFIPQTRAGMRSLDEYELMEHYRLWQSDFDNAAELGVSHMRWGVPWYRVNPAPGVFEWNWIDKVLDYLVNVKKIQPIIDLMHYGTPFWLENSFLHTDYPQYVAEYTHAFAYRYKDLVRFYTPLNEPMVNAEFCGKRAEWPPYLSGDDGYVKLLLPIARGTVLTAHAIREADTDAVLVQVEALGTAWTKDERLHHAVIDWNEDRFLAFDLISGLFSDRSHLFDFMMKHGTSESDMVWFHDHGFKSDVLGVNFYPISGGELVMDEHKNPRLIVGLDASHLLDVFRIAWDRYHLPMMLTETGNTESHIDNRIQWMDDTVAAARQANKDGIQVVGYTWWPLFDMAHWDYRLEEKPLSDYLLDGGLWSCTIDEAGRVSRRQTALAQHYREFIQGKR